MNFKKILLNIFLYSLFLVVCAVISFHTFSSNYAGTNADWSLNTPLLQDFWNLSAFQFNSIFGPSDIANYVRSALFLLQNGHFETSMIGIWPPGYSLFIAGILKFAGENNYPLKLFISTIILWSAAFLFIYHAFPSIKNSFIKILLAMLPIYFETFREWAFGLGAYMSEAVALPLFIITISFFIKWLQTQQTRDLVWMGIFWGLCAYFRGYFELFGNFMLLMLAAGFIVSLFFAFLKMKLQIPNLTFSNFITRIYINKQYIFSNQGKAILLALLSFVVVLLPWRIHMHHIFGDFSWQHISGLIWQDGWRLKVQYFPDLNLPCQIQPDLCQLLNQNTAAIMQHYPKLYYYLTLITFLEHPVVWYGVKLKYFNSFWFGQFGGIPWSELLASYRVLFLEGCIMLLSGFVVTIASGFLWLHHSLPRMKILFLFSILMITFNICLFTFFHFEPRYSLFLKIYLIYSPIALWVLLKEELFSRNLAPLKTEKCSNH